MQKLENTVYHVNGDEILLSQIESGGELPPKSAAKKIEQHWLVVDIEGIMEPAIFEQKMQDCGIDIDSSESTSSNS